MRLFSYIITHDTGFAPNPFWGYCTLACCKPSIRRTAQKGDWIVGLSSKRNKNRLIYAMQVSEKMTLRNYWGDKRFANKKADYNRPEVIHRCGDNIYEPGRRGFKQHHSMHSKGKCVNSSNKKRDLSGKYALISRRFVYLGSEAIPLPRGLRCIVATRGHRSRFPECVVSRLERFVLGRPSGIQGPPTSWPPGDDSWRETNG